MAVGFAKYIALFQAHVGGKRLGTREGYLKYRDQLVRVSASGLRRYKGVNWHWGFTTGERNPDFFFLVCVDDSEHEHPIPDRYFFVPKEEITANRIAVFPTSDRYKKYEVFRRNMKVLVDRIMFDTLVGSDED